MSRLLRIQYPGAIYHAMARGAERRKLFGDARDLERFLHELDECVETFAIRLYAFCLFGTHYHLDQGWRLEAARGGGGVWSWLGCGDQHGGENVGEDCA